MEDEVDHPDDTTPDRNLENGPPYSEEIYKMNLKEKHIFESLQAITNAEETVCLVQTKDSLKSLQTLFQSSIENPDIFVLAIKLLSIVSRSSMDDLKCQLITLTFNSKFIAQCKAYLMDLPYVTKKDMQRNFMYWNNPNEFWKNFVEVCGCIVVYSSSNILKKCRSLIESASKACLDGLEARHQFGLSEECDSTLKHIWKKLHASDPEIKKAEKTKWRRLDADASAEPPDDFRKLSVFPTHEDFLDVRPFLRPNIVQGSYRDAEHYLDVQFRLMREDCMGPLREGISQYYNLQKNKCDNIRIYPSVKFVERYFSENQIGVIVQFDDNTNKKLKWINWESSKRLIFGSLLLFTNDNLSNVITATVMDRDLKELKEGRIAVSILNGPNMLEIFGKHFTMIESEVYFEPYFHVLTALQDPTFPEHFAMEKYIVRVDPSSDPPSYLEEDSVYKMYSDTTMIQVNVLENSTWPSNVELGLDPSQYEAYKLGLTQEFAVIQGPPGTGKTFIGVKIARTLLENLNTERILLICYTNHALDQFLEAILKITPNAVRIGGQSRSEEIKNINISMLRRNADHRFSTKYKVYQYQLKRAAMKLQHAQEFIDDAKSGILSYETIKFHVPSVRTLAAHSFGSNGENPIKHWLFENVDCKKDVQIDFVDTKPRRKLSLLEELDFTKNEIMMDDYETEEQKKESVPTQTCFTLVEAVTEISRLYGQCKKAKTESEKDKIKSDITRIRCQIRLFQDMSTLNKRHRNDQAYLRIDQKRHPKQFSTEDRWSLYFAWAKIVTKEIMATIETLQDGFKSALREYEEARTAIDLEILGSSRVIGMTTSGAARLRPLLQQLQPEIMIVEEAAEVLESHIITALTKGCQHLILIGDHQQLRPSAAHFRLARHYNMEISLFERMISNGVHSRRLAVQHRMRPQIAALISPAIYPELANHASVEAFPAVRGMVSSLFFVTHDFKEEAGGDNSSPSNQKEADLLLGLANYLIQQEYQPEDVTILATYTGQMLYMRRQRHMYDHLSKVKITVVDNYQGEESKIILLSLVRNNDEKKIGFLGSVNRVCVALSRAREGFYMFGNMDLLVEKSSIWRKIAQTLQCSGSIGPCLELRCENHTDQHTMIQTPADFAKVPKGGCLQKCRFNLPCGHHCEQPCHGFDRQHLNIECSMPCERTICESEHVCPLPCKDDCQPCKKQVVKLLPCGHKRTLICHQDPEDPLVKCQKVTVVMLPDCGHQASKPCGLPIEKLVCHEPCPNRVESCGHQCRLECHVYNDPYHQRYLCKKPCGRAKSGCSAESAELADRLNEHLCRKLCHQPCEPCTLMVMKQRSGCSHADTMQCSANIDITPCPAKCKRTLPCGHPCKLACAKPCGNCKTLVTKKIPECGHAISIECREEPRRSLCCNKCERMLSCGHPCTANCNQPCTPTACTAMVDMRVEAPCGHSVSLPCHLHQLFEKGDLLPETLLQHCKALCGVTLECSHLCSGSCGSCRQGRLHVPCSQRCNRLNLCGHYCKESCIKLCPPCDEECQIKCDHAKCRKLCGTPCTTCKEKCSRGCPHAPCSQRCGAQCSRAACSRACSLRLACGHACRGVCGEPCPDICNICRPGDFPRDLLGAEYTVDDLLIQLQDCSHVLELDSVDHLMSIDDGVVGLHACPVCRKPIINTPRYKNIVMEAFKKEIIPIKEKVYGNKKTIETRRNHFDERMKQLADKVGDVIKDNPDWRRAFRKLSDFFKTKTEYANLLELELLFVYLNILDILAASLKQFKKENLEKLSTEFYEQIKMICVTLSKNINTLSRQLQKDIRNELKRTQAILNLSKILSNEVCTENEANPKIEAAIRLAKKAAFTFRIFHQKTALDSLNHLHELLNIVKTDKKRERSLEVRILSFEKELWFKCPNGHLICLLNPNDRCNECGVLL